MKKEERDKLIVEALGGCWHILSGEIIDWHEDFGYQYHCMKCGQNIWKESEKINLSTPNGFFWAWDRAKEKEWWEEFWAVQVWEIRGKDLFNRGEDLFIKLIHPDRFADALAEFLERRKK